MTQETYAGWGVSDSLTLHRSLSRNPNPYNPQPARPVPAHKAKAEFLTFLPSLFQTCSFSRFLPLQMVSPLPLTPVRNLEAVLTPLSSTAPSDKHDCGRLPQTPRTPAHSFLPLRLRLHCLASRLRHQWGYHLKYGPFM